MLYCKRDKGVGHDFDVSRSLVDIHLFINDNILLFILDNRVERT